MVYLYDKKTGSLLGQISAEQLQFLIDQLKKNLWKIAIMPSPIWNSTTFSRKEPVPN